MAVVGASDNSQADLNRRRRGPWRRGAVLLLVAVLVYDVSLVTHVRVWGGNGPELDAGVQPSQSALSTRMPNLAHAPGSVVFTAAEFVLAGRPDPKRPRDAALVYAAFGAVTGGLLFGLLSARRWLSGGHDAGSAAPERRRVVFDATFAAVAAPAVGAWVYGAGVEPWRLHVRRYSLAVPDLPLELEGLRIAHVSDLHIGPGVADSIVRDAVDAAVEASPDLIVLTGDIVDYRIDRIERLRPLVAPLIAAAPTAAVLGNHDWNAGGVAVGRLLSAMGASMIAHRVAWYDPIERAVSGVPGAGLLRLIGVGDATTGRGNPTGIVANANRGPEAPTLLCTHNPDVAEHAALRETRIDLLLAGHTHGGQVAAPLIGPLIVNCEHGRRYSGGLVQGPACPVLVSRGVGTSYVPVRIGAPPEIGVVGLTRG